MDSKNENTIYATAIGLMALFIFILEPYATTRALSEFLLVAGFMGIVILFGIILMLIGFIKFITKQNSFYFQLGLVCVLFAITMSSLPLEMLFSPLF